MNSTQWRDFDLPQMFANEVWSQLGEVNIRVTQAAATVTKSASGLPLVEVFFKPSRCDSPPCQTLVTRKHTNSSGWTSFGGIAAQTTAPSRVVAEAAATSLEGRAATPCAGGVHEVVVSLAGFHTEVVRVQVVAQQSIDLHVQLQPAVPTSI